MTRETLHRALAQIDVQVAELKDCVPIDARSFLKMAKRTPLVALVRVTKYLTFKDSYGSRTPMSMEVELLEVYKGNETQRHSQFGAILVIYAGHFFQNLPRAITM